MNVAFSFSILMRGYFIEKFSQCKTGYNTPREIFFLRCHIMYCTPSYFNYRRNRMDYCFILLPISYWAKCKSAPSLYSKRNGLRISEPKIES